MPLITPTVLSTHDNTSHLCLSLGIEDFQVYLEDLPSIYSLLIMYFSFLDQVAEFDRREMYRVSTEHTVHMDHVSQDTKETKSLLLSK